MDPTGIVPAGEMTGGKRNGNDKSLAQKHAQQGGQGEYPVVCQYKDTVQILLA